MIILSVDDAKQSLDEIGVLQRSVTDQMTNARTGADEIADRLDSVLFFLLSAGYDRQALHSELLEPMKQWLVFTMAPRWMNEDDISNSDTKYLYDKLISLVQKYEQPD